MSMPSTSRWPSLFTATAMVTMTAPLCKTGPPTPALGGRFGGPVPHSSYTTFRDVARPGRPAVGHCFRRIGFERRRNWERIAGHSDGGGWSCSRFRLIGGREAGLYYPNQPGESAEFRRFPLAPRLIRLEMIDWLRW